MDNYWFFCAKPSICNVLDWRVGSIQLHTWFNELGHKRRVFPNFLNAKVGDITVFYASTPIMALVSLAKIVNIEPNKTIGFEKIRDIKNVPFAVLKKTPGLSKMQFLTSPNGSFFKLTKEEFDIISELAEI